MSDTTTHDPEFAPFWEYAKKGELAFPRCEDCGTTHWYPKPICPACQSSRITWARATATPRLYSWTVVRRAFTPEYDDKIPYIVALVEFADAPGVRLVTNLEPAEFEWQVGMELQPIYPAADDSHPRVTFKAA